MKKFKIVYSPKAVVDRDNLFNTIAYEFHASQTAIKYSVIYGAMRDS